MGVSAISQVHGPAVTRDFRPFGATNNFAALIRWLRHGCWRIDTVGMLVEEDRRENMVVLFDVGYRCRNYCRMATAGHSSHKTKHAIVATSIMISRKKVGIVLAMRVLSLIDPARALKCSSS